MFLRGVYSRMRRWHEEFLLGMFPIVDEMQ